MHRLVPDTPQVVEHVDDIAWVGCVPSKASEEVGLCFFHCHKNAGAGRDLLCQQFAELPQLHEAGYRIIREITLGERCHADQCVIIPV